MKAHGVIASVIAVSVGAAGCTKPGTVAKPPVAKISVSILSAGSFEIGACPGDAPPQANDQVYTLTLGKNFQLRNADAPHGGHHEGPAKQIPGHNPTRMDVFTQLSGDQGSQWATVMILLEKPQGSDKQHLHFRIDGLALRGGEAGSVDVFCGVAMDQTNLGTPQYDPQWLSFRTHRDTPMSKTYGTYNLGLIVRDEKNGQSGQTIDYELPVFIDPGVDNEG